MNRKHYPGHRTAAIIDGDNMTRGGQVCLGNVSRVLGRIATLGEGWPATFAMQERHAKHYMTAYAGHGWGVRVASMEPDAADGVLLDAADDYIAHGVTDLIVASGDHAFVELAGRIRLHVLSYRHHVSRQLQLAATTVRYLDNLGTHAVCGPWCGVGTRAGHGEAS